MKGLVYSDDLLRIEKYDDDGVYELRSVSDDFLVQMVRFQNGVVNKESDTNGFQTDHLIRILIDRIEYFQSGKHACLENEQTLQHLYDALKAQEARTSRRTNEVQREN